MARDPVHLAEGLSDGRLASNGNSNRDDRGAQSRPVGKSIAGTASARLWPHAQGQRRAGRAATGGRLGRAAFVERHRAARAGHGHNLFAGVAGEITLRTARVSSERAKRNQARRTGRTGRPRWAGGARRADFADRSRRALFTLGSRRSCRPSRTWRSLRTLEAARERQCRQYCDNCNGSAHRQPFPSDLRDFKRSISFQMSQSTELEAHASAGSAERNRTFGRAAY
jgi:hypothetical protein